MDNIKEDIFKEIMKQKCIKTLTPLGDLVIRFSVTDTYFVKEVLYGRDNSSTVRARFFRATVEEGTAARRVLVYTDDGYLSFGHQTKYYFPANIKVKPLEDKQIIYPWDEYEPYDTPVWFPGWSDSWSSRSVPEDLGTAALPVDSKMLDAISPYLTPCSWRLVLSRLFSGGDKFARRGNLVNLSYDLMLGYKDEIISHGINNLSSCPHRDADVLDLFRDHLDWPQVSLNFRFDDDSMVRFEDLITWPILCKSQVLSPEMLARQLTARRIAIGQRL